METAAETMLDLLWRNALGVIPLAIIAHVACRYLRCAPTTRHALWALVLAWLVLPVLLPDSPLSRFNGDGVQIAASDGARPDSSSVHPISADRVGDSKIVESLLAGTSEDVRNDSEKEHSPRKESADSSWAAALPGSGSPARLVPSIGSVKSPFNEESVTDYTTLRPRQATVCEPVQGKGGTGIPAPAARSIPANEMLVLNPSTDTAYYGISPKSKQLPPSKPSQSRIRTETGDENPIPVGKKEPAQDGVQVATGSERGRSPGPSVVKFEGSRTRRAFVEVASGADMADSPGAAAKVASVPGETPGWWVVWLTRMQAVSDAVMAFPRMPTFVWLGGGLLVLAVYLVRMITYRFKLQRAVRAGKSTRALVRSCAAHIGLSQVPDVWMMNDGAGPMIWCGRRVRLILPERLWAELDDKGRRAIVCHELAHIRRMDYWVCRLEILVAALYWWHPLVWWIRGRLHEEAEFCCDAWVTWLMPKQRRAYAEALLQAKSFVGTENRATPVAGIGVLSGRARRLARRIKMVMTGTSRPKMSISGTALLAMLALVGWIATPARSCPPHEEHAHEAHDKAKSHAACKHCDSKHCTCDKSPNHEKADARTSYEQFMANRQEARDDHDRAKYAADEARAAYDKAIYQYRLTGGDKDVEARLERLEAMLEELMERMEGDAKGKKAPKMRKKAPTATVRPRAPRAVTAPRAVAAPRAAIFPSGVTTAKKYKLSEGKLNDLTELMVRSDVPILVSPGSNYITVHANDAQHAVFGAFVNVIDGSDETLKESYAMAPGKLEAFSKLMVRSDVPILVSPGKTKITVNGNALEQNVVHAFIRMIDPKDGSASVGSTSPIGVGRAGRADRNLERRRAVEQRAAARELRRIQSRERRMQRDRERERSLEQRNLLRERTRSQSRKRAEIIERLNDSHVVTEVDPEHLRMIVRNAVAAVDAPEPLNEYVHTLEEARNLAELHAKLQLLDSDSDELAERALEIASEVEVLRNEAASMEVEVESLHDRAEDVEAEAENLIESTSDEERSDGLDRAAKSMLEQADEIHHEANRITAEADNLTQKADQLGEHASTMAERSEVMTEFASTLVAMLFDVASETADRSTTR
ncbi:MAG: M56 family metallopeptidase [Planctomycetota bacterium]|jgi:beta-lactamase regulating signal transducer with metallopeptidase domain